MRRRSERGQLTGFLVVLMPALFFAVGLVYDGGEIMNAKAAAMDDAEEAARAGARYIDLGAFHRTGVILPDRQAAIAGANAYLSTEHLSGDAALIDQPGGKTTLVVTVHLQQPMTVLGLGGRWTVQVDGHGQAELLHGIQGAQP